MSLPESGRIPARTALHRLTTADRAPRIDRRRSTCRGWTAAHRPPQIDLPRMDRRGSTAAHRPAADGPPRINRRGSTEAGPRVHGVIRVARADGLNTKIRSEK